MIDAMLAGDKLGLIYWIHLYLSVVQDASRSQFSSPEESQQLPSKGIQRE